MAKSTFDKNMEKVSVEFDKVVDDAKDTAEDIGNRWSRSTTEEKITMILGVVLLILAVYVLRDLVVGIVLLALGILCVSGFFDRVLRDLIRYCKKELGGKKSSKSTEKTSEKSKKDD